MNYAVIKINHHQYLIEAGKEYTVERFDAEVGKYQPQVLAAAIDGKFNVGQPTLDNVKVELEVIAHEGGDKITSRVFRAKSRYRKTTGHREKVTRFKVTKIS